MRNDPEFLLTMPRGGRTGNGEKAMLKAALRFAGSFTLVLAMCAVSYAQADYSTATLRGTVYDQQGAVVAGATVTATNPEAGVRKTTKSGADGTYQIPGLNPATYEVEIEAPGFAKQVAKQVLLTVGQNVIFDAHLKVGSPETVVQVSEQAAPLIETEQTQQANTINQNQIEDLPNPTRTFLAPIFTLPGVGNTAGATQQFPGFYYSTTGISIGSSNGRGNLLTVNSGEDDYGTGTVRYFPPLDAVQEMQVNRNGFQAEFGFASGAAVNVVTKSGTNRFHGSVFGFFDDQITDAENYIDKLDRGAQLNPSNPLAPEPKPFRQQIYTGGSFGGPIKKDKLFFFVSYEFDKFDRANFYPILSSAFVHPFVGTLGDTSCLSASPGNPSLAPSQGCFFQRLANDTSGLDPGDAATAKAFLNSPNSSPQNPAVGNPFFPLSNPTLAQMVNRDNGTFNAPTRTHNLITRFDYLIDKANTLTGTFSLEHGHGSVGGLVPDGEKITAQNYEFLANWAHLFSPTLFNQLLVQVVPLQQYNSFTPTDTGTEIQIEFLPAPFGSFGHNFANTYFATQRRMQFEDNLSWTKGKHNLKFGASYRPAEYKVNNPNWTEGEFDFFGGFPLIPLGGIGFNGFSGTNLAKFSAGAGFCPKNTLCIPPSVDLTGAELFDMGVPFSFEGSVGNGAWTGWSHYAGIYAQDLWKITPRLTLTLGARIDWDAEPSPLSTYIYASPRLGIVWDPFGDHNTVIRTGGGIFVAPVNFLEPFYTNLYGPVTGQNNYLTTTFVNILQPNPTFGTNYVPLVFGLYQKNLGTGPNQLPFGHPTGAEISAAGLGSIDRLVQFADSNFTNQKVYQASLSIERQLVPNLSLEVGYNFYRGVHIPSPILAGYQAAPGPPADPILGPRYHEVAPYTTTVPGGLPWDFATVGTSVYHGGTLSLTKRYSNHLQFQANYTYSRAIDDAVDWDTAFGSFRPNGLSLGQERGVSDFNHTHVFVFNGVYSTRDMGGAASKVIKKIFSEMTVGPIFTATSGVPFDVDIASPFNNGTTPSYQSRPFHAGRNTGLGPGYQTLDLQITKGFRLRKDSGTRLEFTMDTTNLLNRANFAAVYGYFPSSIADSPQAQAGVPVGPFGPQKVMINFANGPFNLHAGGRPTTVTQQNSPLYFYNENPARVVQCGMRFTF